MIQGRDFITLDYFDKSELDDLTRLARRYKAEGHDRPLAGRTLALLFFNASLRTRFSFDIGWTALGGDVVSFNISRDMWNLEMEEGAEMLGEEVEHIKDVARVLSRYVNAVAVRCYSTGRDWSSERRDMAVIQLQKYSDIPILNMESVLYHPCQALADVMTIEERLGTMAGKKIALTWVYSPRPTSLAVPQSLALAAAQFGAHLTVAAPPEYGLDAEILARVGRLDTASGGSIRFASDRAEALRGAEIVYANSWSSLPAFGDPGRETAIRERYKAWRVDANAMALTAGAGFMHAMPIRRNVEVTDDVVDGADSLVYDQAENRLHVQKALFASIVK